MPSNHTSTPSLNFYRPDAHPAAKPPNQQCPSTESIIHQTTDIRMLFSAVIQISF